MVLRNKLGRLAIKLQQNATPDGSNPDYNTLEKTVAEATKILTKFYAQLAEPGYSPVKIFPDSLPDAEKFNNNFIDIRDDFSVLFSEFENLEGVILGQFNYMVSRLNRLNRKLKSISSNLGDFILFSDLVTKDALFFGDSFNNLSRIEVNTPLLNNEQCEVNQVEGIVTLPVDRQKQTRINVTEVPVINSNSNGLVGNNQQLGAKKHGKISDILDNNADTWFEYERVIATDDGTPLTLDFTINMGQERVINFIRVNPNNFGTKTQVQILAIDTSVDGKNFVSIKDDIPIAGFTVEDEENVFTLAPSTSKFSGQGLYTFTPRAAKYVHLTLKQSTPYTITTTDKLQKHRYAIGVRDVDIQALPYKPTGEVISSNYAITDDVRKVVLLSNQNPDGATTSTLAAIDHFISPDNGVTWHQLRPRESAGSANVDQTIPELIDFNGVEEDSVITNNPVRSLRYKAVLSRNTEAFTSDSSELAQVKEDTTELHSPPTTTPFEIALQKTPITGTLKLIDPQFGSRGKEDVKYQIAVGTGGKLIILLPFKPLVRDFQKTEVASVWTLIDKDPEQIYVDGELWTRGPLTGSSKNYKLNYEEGRIEFGDGTNGAAVPQGSVISMTLAEERIFPTRGADHIAKLDYPTANDQKRVEIACYSPPKSHTTVLKKGATRHQVFIDGSTELVNPGDFSFDFKNGVLYSKTATNTTTDTSIIYFYNPRDVLADQDWRFTNSGGGTTNAVSLSDRVYKTFTADPLPISNGLKYFNLAHLGIVRGTVRFSGVTAEAPAELSTEVNYIDGRSELLGVVQAKQEIDPITGVTPGVPVSVPFTVKVSSNTEFSVTFSNQSIFVNEVASAAAVDAGNTGDYFVDRTTGTSATGRVYVKLADNVDEPGTINYYYTDPQAALAGRYSINYETGEVFCYSATPSNLAVDYEYTDYRAQYDIARLVPSDDWKLDTSSNTLTIKDREILRSIRVPQQTSQTAGSSRFYQVSYTYVKETRNNTASLEPFFSPILKDYVLKIVTKSRLV
jgi:hypothetical protein